MSKKNKNHKNYIKNVARYRVSNNELISINNAKCIGCTACAFTCANKTSISVLKADDTGGRRVSIPKKHTFKKSGCIYCGQCTLICPTSAADVSSDIEKVTEALADESKYLVAISAPAIKATLGEEFDLPIGTNTIGKVAASARKLGFKKAFDTEFGADITVIEEATELIKRLSTKENLPLFTSCCPAWVRWAELFRSELLNNISTCKSPQQIMGAVIKTYYSDKMNLDPKNIFVVAIKPCTAKKYEITLPNMGRDGYQDIDAVLTVREYAKLLKLKGININDLNAEYPDKIIGEFTGSASIFGASSGVTLATLRAVCYYLKDDISKIDNLVFNEALGLPGVNEANLNLAGNDLKIATISGIGNGSTLLNSDKWKEYDFIEVMACPGGCINGGGNPKILKKNRVNLNLCVACGTCIENCPVGAINILPLGYAKISKNQCVGCTLCNTICRSNAIDIDYYDKATDTLLNESYISLRSKVLKDLDKSSKVKFSPENSEIQTMYSDYIGEPDGDKAKSLFHTTYQDKSSDLRKK